MPTILGVNFGRDLLSGGGLKTWKNKAEKTRGKISPSNFAEKFAGDLPKIRRTKRKKSPQIRSAEPRAPKILWPVARLTLNGCFSEPLLRTLLRTLFYCKTHSRTLSQNPSPEPFPVSVGLLGGREQGNLRKCSPSALESALRNRGAPESAPESALDGALPLFSTKREHRREHSREHPDF